MGVTFDLPFLVTNQGTQRHTYSSALKYKNCIKRWIVELKDWMHFL